MLDFYNVDLFQLQGTLYQWGMSIQVTNVSALPVLNNVIVGLNKDVITSLAMQMEKMEFA